MEVTVDLIAQLWQDCEQVRCHTGAVKCCWNVISMSDSVTGITYRTVVVFAGHE